jgi:hypothetical protein
MHRCRLDLDSRSLCKSLRVEGKVVVVIFRVLAVDIGALRRGSWCVSLGMKGIVVVIVVVVAIALVDDVGVGAILGCSPFVRRRNQALMLTGPKVICGPYKEQAQGEGNPPTMR